MAPDRFEGMLASVVQSQDVETILGKQPILAEYGSEVRKAINALPPEVSRALMNEYREPTPQLVAAMEGAIMSRELAIENAAQEKNLDREYFAEGGSGRSISENAIGAKDDWMVEPEM
jgi:hypothetical protein